MKPIKLVFVTKIGATGGRAKSGGQMADVKMDKMLLVERMAGLRKLQCSAAKAGEGRFGLETDHEVSARAAAKSAVLPLVGFVAQIGWEDSLFETSLIAIGYAQLVLYEVRRPGTGLRTIRR